MIRRLVIVAFAGGLLSVAWATEPARDGVRAAERDGGQARADPAQQRPVRPGRRPHHAGRKHRRIRWRASVAVGRPDAGRLIRGVMLPAQGVHFFTWDPVLRRAPDRWWRRFGTARLIRTLLSVIDAYAAAHPGAPRVGVGDLSRPGGGDFGPAYGGIGHASHQNGLDADVYCPRLDRRERSPATAAQIDRRLAQDLVDRFVAAGAQLVFVGPATALHGPPGVVQVLAHHDNHLHVRLPQGSAT